MRLHDLTTAEGLERLVAVTGGTESYFNHPERAPQVGDVAQRAITQNPNMGHLPVRLLANTPNAYYNHNRKEIALGITNPAALAHELEHAHNLRQQGLYQKVLRAAQGLSHINTIAALPVMLALRTFIKDPQRQDEILQTLAAASAAVAAPELVEETAATVRAIAKHPNRMQALATLSPALLAHYMTNLAPTLIYQAGRP